MYFPVAIKNPAYNCSFIAFHPRKWGRMIPSWEKLSLFVIFHQKIAWWRQIKFCNYSCFLNTAWKPHARLVSANRENLQHETNHTCKQERSLTKGSEIEGPQQNKWSVTQIIYFNYVDFFLKLKKINIANPCIVCNVHLCIDLVSKFCFSGSWFIAVKLLFLLYF